MIFISAFTVQQAYIVSICTHYPVASFFIMEILFLQYE